MTRKAGPGYADPDHDLSVDWLAAHDAVAAAQATQADATSQARVLVIIGSARNDGSCPGEISKSFRLARWMTGELQGQGMAVDTYQAPSPLKLMIDRLVCGDGGNPDPSSTHGKKAEEAKELEQKGWEPGRAGLWPDGARRRGRHRGFAAQLERLAGLDGPDRLGTAGAARSFHRLLRALRDQPRGAGSRRPVQQEARNVALAVAHAAKELRTGTLAAVQPRVNRPRPK